MIKKIYAVWWGIGLCWIGAVSASAPSQTMLSKPLDLRALQQTRSFSAPNDEKMRDKFDFLNEDDASPHPSTVLGMPYWGPPGGGMANVFAHNNS